MNLSRIAVLAAGLAIFTTGCSDESSSPFQPNIANLTDTFSVQASGLANVSATEVYLWDNPGITADVGQSGVLSAGSAALTVADADGTVVYSSDLVATGTFSTLEGAPGAWTVRLVLASVSGSIDFSLQTP